MKIGHWFAHMIGRYKLELGDFVSTYTEERR